MTRKVHLALLAGLALFGLAGVGQIYAAERAVGGVSSLAPINPVIAADIVETRFARARLDPAEGESACGDEQLRSMAIDAVAAEPLLDEAISGLVYAGSCDSDARLAGIAVAGEPLNRRSLPLQLALLQTAASEGDEELALTAMRRIMAVHPDLDTQLAPVFIGALEGTSDLAPVLEVLREQPNWAGAVVEEAAQSADPSRLLFLRRGLGEMDTDFAAADETAVRRLAARSESESAWEYLAVADPRQAASRMQQPLRSDSRFRPFGWNLSRSQQLRANLSASPDTLLTANLRLRAAGTIADQMFPVGAGPYRLTIARDGNDAVALAAYTRCAAPEPARTEWVEREPGMRLSFGEECALGEIRLDARSGPSRRRENLTIESVRLEHL